MDKVTTKIQMIARMASALGTSIEDGDEAAHSITGVLSTGHYPGIIYQDNSCKVVVGLNSPAISALIKPPIQADGTTNPVLAVDQQGEILRWHGEVDALLAYLKSCVEAALTSTEQAQWQKDMVNHLHSDSDLFHREACGNWAKGIVNGNGYKPGLGWLIAVEDEALPSREAEAIEAFKRWEVLPPGYLRLGKDEAEQIVALGVAQHGVDFVDGTCDANDLDCIVQQVLLGEVVYG